MGGCEFAALEGGHGFVVKAIGKGLVVFEPCEADVFGVGRGFYQADAKAVGVGAGRTLGFGEVGKIGGPPDHVMALLREGPAERPIA